MYKYLLIFMHSFYIFKHKNPWQNLYKFLFNFDRTSNSWGLFAHSGAIHPLAMLSVCKEIGRWVQKTLLRVRGEGLCWIYFRWCWWLIYWRQRGFHLGGNTLIQYSAYMQNYKIRFDKMFWKNIMKKVALCKQWCESGRLLSESGSDFEVRIGILHTKNWFIFNFKFVILT